MVCACKKSLKAKSNLVLWKHYAWCALPKWHSVNRINFLVASSNVSLLRAQWLTNLKYCYLTNRSPLWITNCVNKCRASSNNYNVN
ncbi:Uncharacterised protein [Vibrio cholerae]|nr:Uncharacterised protein [Vibrio cholerae]